MTCTSYVVHQFLANAYYRLCYRLIRFAVGEAAMCAYIIHAHADMLIIVQCCVTSKVQKTINAVLEFGFRLEWETPFIA